MMPRPGSRSSISSATTSLPITGEISERVTRELANLTGRTID